jgi:uncharacterized protein (DUF4415 family)
LIRISSQSDEDIEKSTSDDPNWQILRNLNWSKVDVIEPVVKHPISIRLDPDVLAYFKAGGPRYQSRINAVLKAYVRAAEKRRAKAADKP